MFPKGTVKAAVKPAEKPPFTAQKESAVVNMVDNADSQVVTVNDPYWRTQRARICACAVVLTTLILVAGTLVGITIVLTHENRVETTDTTPSLNHDREPLLSNDVPLPKLPESTILIKIDDGGLFPPTEPATPDLVAIDDVTDDSEIELLPSVSLSSSDYESSAVPSYLRGRNYISSSFPYDGWYANGQEGTPPWERDSWIGPSERAREETDVEVSGDDQENDYGSAEPDPTPSLNHDREHQLSKEVPLPKLPESTIRIKIDDGGLLPSDDIAKELLPETSLSSGDYGSELDSPTLDTSVNFPDSSSDAYHWRSRPSDGITAYSSLDRYDYVIST